MATTADFLSYPNVAFELGRGLPEPHLPHCERTSRWASLIVREMSRGVFFLPVSEAMPTQVNTIAPTRSNSKA